MIFLLMCSKNQLPWDKFFLSDMTVKVHLPNGLNSEL